MIRWSCHRAQGWVPVAPSWSPSSRARAWSCPRRVAIRVAASAKSAHFPVRTSASEAISSPTRWSSTSAPAAEAFSSSNRLTRSSVSGSSSANSSSTATVKSVPSSYAARALASCSSAESRCSSPIGTHRLTESPGRPPALRAALGPVRLEQPGGDARPRPARDRGAAGGRARLLALLRRKREQGRQLRAQVGDAPALEGDEPAQPLRVLRLEPGGDLREPGVAGDERRAAGRSRLGRDHPERLGEDRGDDRDVAERQQVDEVAMLERPGEEDALGRRRLERAAVVAEADDHRPRVEVAQRLEQELHALVLDQLPEVDDGRLLPGEERGQALRVPLVREPLVRAARVRRVAARLREQAGEGRR